MDLWRVLDRRINDMIVERPSVASLLAEEGVSQRFFTWRLRDAVREAGLDVGVVGTRVANLLQAA